jgi:hypothetical protein
MFYQVEGTTTPQVVQAGCISQKGVRSKADLAGEASVVTIVLAENTATDR